MIAKLDITSCTSRTPSPLAGEGWGGGRSRTNDVPLPPSRRASRVDLPRKGGDEEQNAWRVSF